MILIDKHAAHERLLFEKLKKSNKSIDMQNLLEPIVVTLDKSEYSALIESQELISDAGFLIDDFGEGTVIVRSVPMYINLSEVSGIISEIASYILNNKKDLKTQKLDWLYHNIACRSAIKAGKESSKEEILELDKNDIYNIWEERVKQVLETNGMNLNNNAALINSMFECARKHIDVD